MFFLVFVIHFPAQLPQAIVLFPQVIRLARCRHRVLGGARMVVSPASGGGLAAAVPELL